MNLQHLQAFLPELVLLAGALALFFTTVAENPRRGKWAKSLALVFAFLSVGATLLTLGEQATLFCGAYRVDAFSQVLKLFLTSGLVVLLLLEGDFSDFRPEFHAEAFLFILTSVIGLVTLVSCVDFITLFVALQTAAFPLYVLVPMRRERAGHREQMESAIKYVMFGVAANAIMLFGFSYLFAVGGSTSLPVLMHKLQPLNHSPLVIAGLALTFAGLFYKLAIFPFHFWTPDVYQGSANETTGLIASLPKIGAVAVLVRLVHLSSPDNHVLAWVLASLAVASMLYGNLVALFQTDLKRLLAFSGIAHAGYAVIGLVALDDAGSVATLFYISAYAFTMLACFLVICRVSTNGDNLEIKELAGLHRRSPWLAFTLLVGIFTLAGIPPFAGFMGKLALLKAALAKGYLALVIIAVLNTAIAIYYYLGVIRESFFQDPGSLAPVPTTISTRALCLFLVAVMVLLGVYPAPLLEFLSGAVSQLGR